LGGFNVKIFKSGKEGLDISYMNYDRPRKADNSLMALMHNMSDFEYERTWARCYKGTGDVIASIF